jgi:hypothetical protein
MGVIWNLKILAAAATAIAISSAGIAWFAHSKGRASGMSQIQMLWDAERAVQLAAQAEAEMKARQTEQALQAAINRIKQEKTREAIKLANDYAAVVDSLHDRAETRAGDGGVPEGAVLGVGCTGQGLARPDAEFLAGYARDAGRLQLALNVCRQAYTEIERKLNIEKPLLSP